SSAQALPHIGSSPAAAGELPWEHVGPRTAAAEPDLVLLITAAFPPVGPRLPHDPCRELLRCVALWLASSPYPQLGPHAAQLPSLNHLLRLHYADMWPVPGAPKAKFKDVLLGPSGRGAFRLERDGLRDVVALDVGALQAPVVALAPLPQPVPSGAAGAVTAAASAAGAAAVAVGAAGARAAGEAVALDAQVLPASPAPSVPPASAGTGDAVSVSRTGGDSGLQQPRSSSGGRSSSGDGRSSSGADGGVASFDRQAAGSATGRAEAAASGQAAPLDRHLASRFPGDDDAAATKRCFVRLLAAAPPPHELPLSHLGAEVPRLLGGARPSKSVRALCGEEPGVFEVELQAPSAYTTRLACPVLTQLAAVAAGAPHEAWSCRTEVRRSSSSIFSSSNSSSTISSSRTSSSTAPLLLRRSTRCAASRNRDARAASKRRPPPRPAPPTDPIAARLEQPAAPARTATALPPPPPPLPPAAPPTAVPAPAPPYVLIDDPYSPELVDMLQHCRHCGQLGLSVKAAGRFPALVSLYAPAVAAAAGAAAAAAGDGGAQGWPAAVYLLDCTAADGLYGGGAGGEAAVGALLSCLRGLLADAGVAKVVYGVEGVRRLEAAIKGGVAAVNVLDAQPLVSEAVIMAPLHTQVVELSEALAVIGLWADRPELLAALKQRHLAAMRDALWAASGRDRAWLVRPLGEGQLAVVAGAAHLLPELWGALVGEAVPRVAARAGDRLMQQLRPAAGRLAAPVAAAAAAAAARARAHCRHCGQLGLAVQAVGGRLALVSLYAPAMAGASSAAAAAAGDGGAAEGWRPANGGGAAAAAAAAAPPPPPPPRLLPDEQGWPAAVYLLDCTAADGLYGGGAGGEAAVGALLSCLRGLLVDAGVAKVAGLHAALAGTGLWADRPELLAALTQRHLAAMRDALWAASGRDRAWLVRPLGGSQLAVAAGAAHLLPELWGALVGEAVPRVAARAGDRLMQQLRSAAAVGGA
ncbi:hypothetical protein TSOC_010418, partial [Tetrabaena socialis]